MDASRNQVPKPRAIREYWALAFNEAELWRKTFDSPEEFLDTGACFACGWEHPLQRAHIVPRWKGGPDGAHNLHLLCCFCHEDSEWLVEPEDYWAWFWQRTVWDMLARGGLRSGKIHPTEVAKTLLGVKREEPWYHVPPIIHPKEHDLSNLLNRHNHDLIEAASRWHARSVN